ncbi:MAG TPA: GMC family oxidoreductase, partial [Vicinamibacteria bacterium]|nr:GMC family oxidoreductase [Vicinamibacteria bacterium]
MSAQTYDAIVVGSGMTGGWAAKELTEAGLRTLVLERGGPVAHVKDYPTARLDPWELPYGNLATQQDLKDYPIQSQLSFLFGQDVKHFLVKDVEHPYEQSKPFHWFRGYQVGGRSLLWSRHCFRWSDLDFEANLKEGVGIDWPLRYADIAPWYDRVQAFIGISGEKAGLPQLPEGDLLPPFEMNCFEQHLRQSIATSFPGRNLIMSHVAVLTRPHNGRGACQGRNLCHRGCPYGAYFSSNSSTLPAAAATGRLTLRPHSIAHSLVTDHETGRAKGVRVIDAETGKAEEFHARVVFLNASTLATTGLLLHSTSDRFPNGFANGSGVLGHYLMDHTNAAGAMGGYSGLADKYYKGRRPSGMYIPRFRNLRPAEGRPFTRGYAFEVYTGRSGWQQRKDAPGLGADLKESIARPGDWYAYMEGYCETLPRYENTVGLSREKRDRWGLPLLKVDMAYGGNERAMLKDVKETATEMLKAAGCEGVQGFEKEPVPGEVIHEMGTAR